MSLPGDRKIDTDPQDDPQPLEIIREVRDQLEGDLAAVADAATVLDDEDASPEARALAFRALSDATRGYTQLLDTIVSQAVRLHEEAETFKQNHVA